MNAAISVGSPVPAQDRSLIRDLLARYAPLAKGPKNAGLIESWRRHNSLRGGRPLILVFPEGGWGEIEAVERRPAASDATANGLCGFLWQSLWLWERCGADNPLHPWLTAPRCISSTGWGLEAEWTHSSEARGARAFKPVLHGPADLERIATPRISEDVAGSEQRFRTHRELIGDAMPVFQAGISHISFHLMRQYTAWRGLEQMMMDMYDEPELLHGAMRRLADGHKSVIEQYVRLGLLTANADNTYQSSGGNGWCDDLPPGPGAGTPSSMWASAESQELAGVCPAMHRNFALAYESELLSGFAHAGYGCCEALDRKIDDIFAAVPRIRRLSISPWADVTRCANALAGRRAIYSWKANPVQLVGTFEEAAIRRNIHETVRICRDCDCQLEIVLKDTHTCENRPERFVRWVQLCREAIVDVWGPE